MKLYKSKKESEIYYYFNAKEDKMWMFRHKYYDTFGKRKEKKKSGFKTEKAALKALIEVKATLLRGESKQVEHDQLTVAQWLDLWYEANKGSWKKTSQIQRENAIKYQMKPLLGHYKLQNLNKVTYIREFIDVLKKDYKPNTVKLFHRLFKVAINAAVDDEILTRNRFTKIALYPADEIQEKKNNYLTPAQLVSLLKTAKQEVNITNYTFIYTVAYTGMRRGEACGIQWGNVDFYNKTIKVERTRDNKGTRTPKTKNSYRTILIDDLLVKQLKEYRKWCKQTMLSFGYKLNDDSFVFVSYQTGRPITEGSLHTAFKKVLKAAALPDVTIHGLRHTHATILLNQKLTVSAIAERLGNTPQMIYDIYGHILKEVEQESVSLFSQSLIDSGAKSGANF